MTVRLQNRNNQVDDNSNDEDDNDQLPDFCARPTFSFEQFVTAIDAASDNDTEYNGTQASFSVDEDQSSEIHASSDEQIFSEGQLPHFRKHNELENDSDIDSIAPREFEEK
ncbi:MAG: hypothetical protein EZS28_004022 [Streblomastix strix]|uniref:Uncharacterized protein n=1 Tax=Streblomastix strix TaxID=222440 RepID=A0A5J4X112_9EUKA|nr:MAG: hypothetical protein EZS28_004022 [Streblomastix strix]